MRVLIPDIQDDEAHLAHLGSFGPVLEVWDGEHMCESITRDPDGFAIGECSCGYETFPVPSLDLMVDELMSHAVGAALSVRKCGLCGESLEFAGQHACPRTDVSRVAGSADGGNDPRNENYAEGHTQGEH